MFLANTLGRVSSVTASLLYPTKIETISRSNLYFKRSIPKMLSSLNDSLILSLSLMAGVTGPAEDMGNCRLFVGTHTNCAVGPAGV